MLTHETAAIDSEHFEMDFARLTVLRMHRIDGFQVRSKSEAYMLRAARARVSALVHVTARALRRGRSILAGPACMQVCRT